MAQHFLVNSSNEGCSTGGGISLDMTPTIGTRNTITGKTNSATFVEILNLNVAVGVIGNVGEWRVSLDIINIDSGMEVRGRLQRLNSSCVIQESSVFSGEETAVGVRTNNIPWILIWATDDVLRLSIEGRRVAGHGNKSISLSIDDPDCFVLNLVGSNGDYAASGKRLHYAAR